LTTSNNGRHVEYSEYSDSNDVTEHWDKDNRRIMTPPESSELRNSGSDSDFQATSSEEESDSGSVQEESEDATNVVVESSDIGHAATKRNAVNVHWLHLVRRCSPSFTESKEGPGLLESRSQLSTRCY
jgi:hypothetical protein